MPVLGSLVTLSNKLWTESCAFWFTMIAGRFDQRLPIEFATIFLELSSVWRPYYHDIWTTCCIARPCPTSVEVKTPQLLDPSSAWIGDYPRSDGKQSTGPSVPGEVRVSASSQ
ncbi:hypothetical protein KC344_g123 [Hortaea werneckii]|nr:hypothetical protein KC344_g123 [Hortaea werneckii]